MLNLSKYFFYHHIITSFSSTFSFNDYEYRFRSRFENLFNHTHLLVINFTSNELAKSHFLTNVNLSHLVMVATHSLVKPSVFLWVGSFHLYYKRQLQFLSLLSPPKPLNVQILSLLNFDQQRSVSHEIQEKERKVMDLG